MPRVCPGGMLAAGIDSHNIGELVTSIPFSIMNEDHFSVIVFSCLHGCSKALVPYKFTRGSIFLKVTIKKETDRKSTACNAQLVSIFIYDFKKLLFQSVHLCCIFQNFKLNNKQTVILQGLHILEKFFNFKLQKPLEKYSYVNLFALQFTLKTL